MTRAWPVWPVWPVQDGRRIVHTHGGRAFGALRADGKRYHAGMDLSASAGDIVVAPEDGQVVAVQGFNGPRAWAILIEGQNGVVLLGEVEPRSWTQLGVDVGSFVSAGQPVARVGVNPGGSSMLHFEMYAHGTRRNHPWYVGQNPPLPLVDPTSYLMAAADGQLHTEETTEDHDHDGTPKSQSLGWISLLAGLALFWIAAKGGRL